MSHQRVDMYLKFQLHNIILFLNRCCSYIGRRYPYVQQVNVGPECSFRSIVHEIGHVIGFWHEENRPDRDEYITIDSQSIILGLAYNFNKTNTSSVNSLGVPYDFGSIMHYYNDSAAKNGTVIITSKEKSMPFGGAPELSSLDIKQTNLLYKKQCGQLVTAIYDYIRTSIPF